MNNAGYFCWQEKRETVGIFVPTNAGIDGIGGQFLNKVMEQSGEYFLDKLSISRKKLMDNSLAIDFLLGKTQDHADFSGPEIIDPKTETSMDYLYIINLSRRGIDIFHHIALSLEELTAISKSRSSCTKAAGFRKMEDGMRHKLFRIGSIYGIDYEKEIKKIKESDDELKNSYKIS